MASSTIRGGLDALVGLGSTDVHGVSKRTGARSWSTRDNGNPAHMLTFVRDLMGLDDNVLFTMERDFNRNVVMYRPALGVTGELDLSTLATASWLMVPDTADLDHTTVEMVDEELVEEKLTALEQLGYGTKVVAHRDDLAFAVAALPDTPMFLVQTAEGQWRAHVEVEGTRWTLNRIMLHTTPRAFGMFPGVSEVHVEVEDDKGQVAQFYYAVK